MITRRRHVVRRRYPRPVARHPLRALGRGVVLAANLRLAVPKALVPLVFGALGGLALALAFETRANAFSPIQFGIFLASLWILIAVRLDRSAYGHLSRYVHWAESTALMGLGLLGTVAALSSGQGATTAERLRSVDFSLAFVTTFDGLAAVLILTLVSTVLGASHHNSAVADRKGGTL